MSVDKIKKLTAYVNQLKEKLSSNTPEKHVDRPNSYKRFLNIELETAQKQIDALRIGKVSDKL